MTDNDHPLNTSWIMWCHENNNKDWVNKSSYIKICKITTVKEYWGVINNMHMIGDLFQKDIFLFRENIFPTWEDVANRNGGALSILLSNTISKFEEKTLDVWRNISMIAVSESMPNDPLDINGISLSLKKSQRGSYGTVKVWNKDATKNTKNDILNTEFTKKYNQYSVIYKKTKPEY